MYMYIKIVNINDINDINEIIYSTSNKIDKYDLIIFGSIKIFNLGINIIKKIPYHIIVLIKKYYEIKIIKLNSKI